MIKAIIFDCFGVLTADKWKEFVGTLPESQKQSARNLNHAYDAGFITENEFATKIVELTGSNPGEVERLRVEEIGKNRELLDYIRQLKPKYKIGLLSNVATNWIKDVFLTEEEQGLFDVMVFSFEAGMTKPDERIYKLILDKLGFPASEAVFIDDIDRYCQAAESVGMRAILYQDFEQMKTELETLLAGANN